MNSTEIIIKIDIIYFLGIIGTLVVFALYAGHRIGGVENSIEWVKRELQNIWDTMKGREAQRSGIEASGSPIQPTEFGWKYLRESGLDKIADEQKKEFLLQTLRSLLLLDHIDHTDYDVQETARRVMVSLRDDPMMVEVKQYAFNNGLDVDMILRLGGLLLRDNFLGQPHKTAPVSATDKQPA